MPALALTDHGVLYGAVQLVRMCRDTSVKPIIGNEMYIVNHPLPIDSSVTTVTPSPKRYHLIVLAKNTAGYRNLVKLTTLSHMSGRVGKGIFSRPCINKAQLFQHREGLIVCSACLGGEIPQAILNDDIDSARAVATWYRDVFGDDFYLEIQDHGSTEDKKVNPVILDLAHQLDIKVIATNDSHFTTCLDAEAHDAMICIQTGKMLTDENRLHYTGSEYFKSVDEMRQCFVDHLPADKIDEALVNTINVAEKVSPYELFGATRIPYFSVPSTYKLSQDEYLCHVSRQGLQKRLADRSRSGLLDAANVEAYTKRLQEELKMIIKMGFASYFLVVWDYIAHARGVKIPVGPGRGSVAGSLVAFALRITDVDPIEFNLLFERFLNPERKSMPDIDTDFSVDGRERVISYVSDRYGADCVAQIITFNRLTSKAVLKDVARVHNVPYADADRLAKLIPVVRGKPATLPQLMSDSTPSKEFKRAMEQNPSYKLWLDKARRIEGANKTFGVHAAGVVISASPLTEVVPLSKSKHGETITQYAMEDVEALGLLKMDFLGLKNLTIIETALEFINEGRRQMGISEDLDFSVDSLPLDDPKTYELLAEGGLDGIFQLDASAGMRKVVRELRPSSIEDISSVLALYRPGPLDAGLIPKFIRRKHGREKIEYDHPLLEPILKDTYGIMVYQEQIMRIARDLAGYSLGQADILRRAMGKKKMGEMEREKPKFIAGAEQRGVPTAIATNLFDQMLKFADYCFNKSHSTAYAFLTYQTAYLKANYPIEYCAALLRSNMNQSDKLVRYLADANSSGVRVRPPSINRSSLGFTVDRSEIDGSAVLFGLEAIKSLGTSVGNALIEERERNGPFCDIIDLIERVDLRLLNKRSLASLVQAGALDELHPNRKVLIERLESLLSLRRTLRDKRKRREAKTVSEEQESALNEEERLRWETAKIELFADSVDRPDYTRLELLAAEKSTLGFYASGHPLSEYQDVSRFLGCIPISQLIGDVNDSDPSELVHDLSGALEDGTPVILLSCVTDLKRITTAKGKKMGKWTMEDMTGRASAVVFPGSVEILEQTMTSISSAKNFEAEDVPPAEPRLVVEEDARVVIWGTVIREASGAVQVVVDDVQRVEDVQVLVATFPEHSPLAPEDYADILRYEALSVLGSDASSDAQGSYVDREGKVQTRRRRKAQPLSLKNRVPLVLEHRSLDGKVSYINIGNNVRFPVDSSGSIDALTQSGFRLRIVSIGKDIIENPPRFFCTYAPESERDACSMEASDAVSLDTPVKQPLVSVIDTGEIDTEEEKDVGRVNLESHSSEKLAAAERKLEEIMERRFGVGAKSLDASLDFRSDEGFAYRSSNDREDSTSSTEDFDVSSQEPEVGSSSDLYHDGLLLRSNLEKDDFIHPAISHIRNVIGFQKKDTFMRQGLYGSHRIASFGKHDVYDNENRCLPSENRTVATIEKPGGAIGMKLSGTSVARPPIKSGVNVESRSVSGFAPKIKNQRDETSNSMNLDIDYRSDGHGSAPVNDVARLKSDSNESNTNRSTVTFGLDEKGLVSREISSTSKGNRYEPCQDAETFNLQPRRERPRAATVEPATSKKELPVLDGDLKNAEGATGSVTTETAKTTKSAKTRKRGRARKLSSVTSPSSKETPQSVEVDDLMSKAREHSSSESGANATFQNGQIFNFFNDNGANHEFTDIAANRDVSRGMQAGNTTSSSFFSGTVDDSSDEQIPSSSEAHPIPEIKDKAKPVLGNHSQDEDTFPNFDISASGVVVDYDNLDFAGVVDAVSLVASAIVSDAFEGGHVITCMSSVCLDNLVEDGVSLQITGRIAYFNGTNVYVLVDVRERVPSGKRKRVRSFGPVAVVLETEKDVGVANLSTKKAKKSLSTFVQKIGKCYSLNDVMDNTTEECENGTTTKGRGQKTGSPITVQASEVGVALLKDFSDRSQASGPFNFHDGGELLGYMARAAEVCAKKAAQDLASVSVGTLEWFVVPSPSTLDDVHRVYTRTHLEGLSFGTMKMQVEAEVLSGSGKSLKLVAAFNVRCENSQVSKRMRVHNDDVSLFDRRDVVSRFADIERNLELHLL